MLITFCFFFRQAGGTATDATSKRAKRVVDLESGEVNSIVENPPDLELGEPSSSSTDAASKRAKRVVDLESGEENSIVDNPADLEQGEPSSSSMTSKRPCFRIRKYF